MSTAFSISVSKWADELGADLETVAKKTALDVLASVRLKTPVGNPDIWAANVGKSRSDPGFVGKGYVGGTLRANWQLSVGAPAQGTRERVDGLFPAVVDDQAALAGFVSGTTIYITNNITYAARAERGWSKQAPAGMVSVTIAEWPQIVREASSVLKGNI